MHKTNRRKFIKEISLSTAGFTIVPRYVLGGKGFTPPSDIVNIGIVGAGGQSMYSVQELLKLNDVKITAIADPADYWNLANFFYQTEAGREPTKKFIEEHYSNNQEKIKVSGYSDFRIMLEKEKNLDAIVCASPDNTHAYISVTAMREGKHVYCEKPLAHNINEVRTIKRVAKETGVATQMGNQGHSRDNFRQTIEYLQADVIGNVTEVHAWVPATRWLPKLNGYPKNSSPVTKGFNWDLWLGPTSYRPFNKAYSPVNWRDFWDFGCGALGDFGCHDMDAATWAFNLHTPISVQLCPAGNSGSSEIAPYGEIGYFRFAKNGLQKELNLTWYSGGLLPKRPEFLPDDVKLMPRGTLFIGEKSIILNNGGTSGKPEIFPKRLRESITPPPQSIPRSKGHHREWIDSIKGGPDALSNFNYAAQLTEIVLLGVLSLRLGGEEIHWDSKNMKAIGTPEADLIIQEPIRSGWEFI